MPQIVGRLLVVIIVALIGEVGLRPVAANPPRINAMTPSGICRGVPTEVVIDGANLTGQPKWAGTFAAGVIAVPGGPTDGKSWRVRITPDPDVPVGVYLVRIVNEGGVSNPFPFAVDQVPHVAEMEENSSFALAQKVDAPVVVEGQASGADVDYFRFSGRKGERVVIDAVCARIGSTVDPSIRLSTVGRRLIELADDSPGLLTDARLFAELPEDGDYVVELADTRYQATGTRTNYRLLIGRGMVAPATIFPMGGKRGESVAVEIGGGTMPNGKPLRAQVELSRTLEVEPGRISARMTEASAGLTAVDPVPQGGWFARDVEALPPMVVGDNPEYHEPLDPAAAAVRAAIPAVFNGRIEAARDRDSFIVTGVTPGQKIRVRLDAANLGSSLDGVLQVTGIKGAVLGTNDDSAIPERAKPKLPATPNTPAKPAILSLDPEIVVAIPADTTEITVSVHDLEDNGGPGFPYRLTVEPVIPGFDLLISTQDQINIPRGGTAGVSVEVERTDFAGPITLTVANPPPGVAVGSGLIPAGQTLGSLSLSAAPDAAFDLTTLRIIGEAAGPAGPMVVEATRTIILAQQGEFATEVITSTGLPAAPASPSPITLTGPTTPVEVVLAYAATFPVKAIRTPEAADVVLTFESLPTIPNIAVAADPKLAAKADAGTITINTNPDLPPGPVVVVFTAKGKFGERDRTIALPAVTLNVVRPADVELLMGSVQLAVGGSAEVKGSLTRRGGFHDPVTIKLDGLPVGLKADPLIVSPEATDFTLKLSAGADAKPGDTTAQVTSAFKLGPKDYATPARPLAIKVVPTP